MANASVTQVFTRIISNIRKINHGQTFTDGQIATYVASRVIGFSTLLPSSPVKHPVESWYIENCLASVEKQVEELNECYVLDVDSVMSAIRNLWRTRYSMVHEAGSEAADAMVSHALIASCSPGNEGFTAPIYTGLLLRDADYENYGTDQKMLYAALKEYVLKGNPTA